MSQLIYIPFDHLHRNFGALREANVKEDVIAFVESARMTTGRPWHPQRLHFLISSARHSETFKKNHRMSQQIFGLNRLSDLPELKLRAKEVLKGLDKGEI